MQLSDQVITLEQAKVLRDIRFKRDSYVSYGGNYESGFWGLIKSIEWDKELCNFAIPAYTASELMELIGPCKILHCSMPNGTIYQVSYKRTDEEGVIYKGTNRNLAQALGDMLIYLLLNGYIQCN